MSNSSPPQLRLFGGALLIGEDGPESGPATRRHPLGLLALLATAPSRCLSRTKLIGLLWPEIEESTGRNRLTSTLYPLRKRLGHSAILSAGDTLRLEAAAVDCDVWRFRAALKRGDDAGATSLYRGPFLDGFYLNGSAPFDQRVERERERIRQEYLKALERVAGEAEANGDSMGAIRWWRERVSADPYDTGAVLRLIEVLLSARNRGEALRVAEAHESRLRRELGALATVDLTAILDELQALPPTPSVVRSAIAVLPFEASGGEPVTALAEGIHAGLMARLSEVTGLGVIARTTALRYRNSDRTISEIGRELGIDWVLEGDVQENAGRFRLNVRLAHTGSERQVWAEEYRGTLSSEDVFELQAATARSILECLKVELSPEEREQVERKPTEEIEAYRLWAQGRMHLGRRSAEEMERAVDFFERATELDPGYVQAWVGLADALGLLHAYGHVPAEEALDRAEEAIDRALDLEPRSAEAHAARGRLLGQRTEALEAQRELELAVSLKPGYAEAHNWLTVGNHVLGRAHAALESARRAVELDPLSPEVIYNLGSAYLINGHHERALEEARRARHLVPSYESSWFLEALTLYEMARYDEAATSLEDAEIPWAGAAPSAVRALALSASGDSAAARRILSTIDRSEHAFDVGLGLAGLGEKEAALDALAAFELAGFEHWTNYWPTVAVRYLFRDVWDLVRDDPRHADLVRRVNRSWGL